MNRYPHPIIAREGWPYVAAAFIAALALTIVAWSLPAAAWWVPAVLAWVAFLFVLQFFRDPPREIPPQPNAVLSPADGRIVRVGKARDPYLDRDALLISVFMNVFNVHSNRSPVDATIGGVWYEAGTFVNAALDKASTANERNAIRLVTPAGVDVTCVQVAGLIARRIVCSKRVGDVVDKGERFGLIKFGSRVDIFFGPEWELAVKRGDKVKGGSSVVAAVREIPRPN